MIKFALFLIIYFSTIAHALEISESIIKKDVNFFGNNLSISDFKEKDQNAILVVKGPKENYKIIKKEKFGILWISAKSYNINSAYSFYKIFATRPLTDITNTKLLKILDIKLTDQSFYIQEKHDLTSQKEFFDAFYTAESLNGMYSNDIQLMEVIENKFFKASLYLPPAITTGDYKVKLYIFDKKGNLVRDAQSMFTIKQSGIEEKIKRLSVDHPLIYSMLAIFMALCIGAITAFIFNGTIKQKISKKA